MVPHIHRLVYVGVALLASRHDPDVLNRAPFQHTSGVDFTLEAACGDVDPAIVKDLKVPAPAQPAVHVGRLGNLRRACGRREQRVKRDPRFHVCSHHGRAPFVIRVVQPGRDSTLGKNCGHFGGCVGSAGNPLPSWTG